MQSYYLVQRYEYEYNFKSSLGKFVQSLEFEETDTDLSIVEALLELHIGVIKTMKHSN